MKKLVSLLMLIIASNLLAANIKVTNPNTQTIRINLDVNDYKVSTAKGYSFINASTLYEPETPGAPLLPEYRAWVVVPPQGQVQIAQVSGKTVTKQLPAPLAPVPDVKPGKKTEDYIYQPDTKAYKEKLPMYSVSTPNTWRSFNIAQVTIRPFSLGANNKTLNVGTNLEFVVTITGNTSYRATNSDKLAPWLKDTLLNPQQANNWQVAPHTRDTTINYAPFAASAWWVKITVNQNGVYRLTRSNLESKIPVADLDPRTFRIFSTGGKALSQSIYSTQYNDGLPFSEIPILVNGESDGSFDDGDDIVFYAVTREGNSQNEELVAPTTSMPTSMWHNPWSESGIYWLTFAADLSTTPNRLPVLAPLSSGNQRTYAMATLHSEQERVRRSNVGYDWYQAVYTGGNTYNHTLSTTNLYTGSDAPDGQLKLGLYLDHSSLASVRVNFNNLSLSTFNWLSYSYSAKTYTIPKDTLSSGSNRVSITPTRSSYFDYLELNYPQRLTLNGNQQVVTPYPNDYGHTITYTLSSSGNNVKVIKTNSFDQCWLVGDVQTESGTISFTGANADNTTYIVVADGLYKSPAAVESVTPNDLTANTSPTDVIIITNKDFESAAQNLATLHKEQLGYNSKVVLQEDIFNQFSSGMPDPGAIRLFLKWAFYNMPSPAPSYAIMFGSGTLDWRNYSGLAAGKNQVMIFQGGSWLNKTSDDFFAYFTQENRPELAIGRIPAQTASLAQAYVDRLSNWYLNSDPGIWRNKVLILADDQYHGSGGGETMHTTQGSDAFTLINRAVYTDMIYAVEYELDQFRNKPQVRDLLMDKINEGCLMWYYIGHGNYDLLGDEDYFRSPADLSLFDNAGKLSLFIAASCEVGQYQHYAFDCIAEQVLFLRKSSQDVGSIASIAATDLSSSGSNTNLIKNFFTNSVNLRQPLGVALMLAKPSGNAGNSRVYGICGDPTLPLVPPRRNTNVSFEIQADSLQARQQVSYTADFNTVTSGQATIEIYDTVYNKTYQDIADNLSINYDDNGALIYKGSANVDAGNLKSTFTVPDDINDGNFGRILNFYQEDGDLAGHTSYAYPVAFKGHEYPATDTTPPVIELRLDSEQFRPGDTVSASPMLIATISDENGVNVMGRAGHKIVINLDDEITVTDVTEDFAYNTGSHTTGTLQTRLSGLSEGHHTLNLIAFDNFNNPAAAQVEFVTTSSTAISVVNPLPYPNPIKKDGYFTFTLTQDASVTIDIYTLSGRRIRSIRASGLNGYNQVYWDGRDAEGDRPANNTYFYKIKARQANGKTAEKTGKVVILK